jgi:hypothetical protein
MKVYEIEQSKSEVQKVYTELIDKITEHVKLLSLNSKPITSVMAMKRDLIRLKIRSMELGAGSVESRKAGSTLSYDMEQGERRLESCEAGSTLRCDLGKEEEFLAMEILEIMGIDVKPAVCAGLVGLKEMKRTLVKFHYEKMARTGMKYKDIKTELSKKYNMSVASIEKMVYKNSR